MGQWVPVGPGEIRRTTTIDDGDLRDILLGEDINAADTMLGDVSYTDEDSRQASRIRRCEGRRRPCGRGLEAAFPGL